MYKVESLDSINKKEKVGTVISMFAGTGGSSLGYKMAGLDVKLVNEFIPIAAENYRENHPNTIVVEEDIRNLTGLELLEMAGLEVGELDILDGSPPCASFSAVGKGDKGWGQVKKYSETKQRVDDLIFEFGRVVREVQPKVFVVENVKGITHKKPMEHAVKPFIEKLKDMYNIDFKILASEGFGVPQYRKRFIMIGVRKDLNITPSFPIENMDNLVSVKDALKNLTQPQEEIDFLIEKMSGYKIGQYLKELEDKPLGSWHHKTFSLCKNFYEEPSRVITQKTSDISAAGVCHPFEHRKHTIAELRRLMSFPDDFKLIGTYQQQGERLGRAVPPLLMKAVASHIKENILGIK